ncbi:MAG: DUF1801 domain-containing protein [Myxococcales bacterium]|nr:DUF1801 domain-containing protein [Myxococcales bacterium]
MAQSNATTVSAYLAELPDDRRAMISALREVILRHLPPGFSEVMAYGMIGYVIPLSDYPNTYNGQPLMLAALASQKGYVSLYLLSIYADPQLCAWFVDAQRQQGRVLDMGKSCLRLRKLDDISLPIVGEAIAKVSAEQFVAAYEASRSQTRKAKSSQSKTSAAKSSAAKSSAAKSSAAKSSRAAQP